MPLSRESSLSSMTSTSSLSRKSASIVAAAAAATASSSASATATDGEGHGANNNNSNSNRKSTSRRFSRRASCSSLVIPVGLFETETALPTTASTTSKQQQQRRLQSFGNNSSSSSRLQTKNNHLLNELNKSLLENDCPLGEVTEHSLDDSFAKLWGHDSSHHDASDDDSDSEDDNHNDNDDKDIDDDDDNDNEPPREESKKQEDKENSERLRELETKESEYDQRLKDAERDYDQRLKEAERKFQEELLETEVTFREQLRETEQRLAEEQNESELRFKEQYQESGQRLAEFREQVTSLQEALEQRDDSALAMRNQLNDAHDENTILAEEVEQFRILTAELTRDRDDQRNDNDNDQTRRDSEKDDAVAAAAHRVEALERELEDATNVTKLQLEELDDEVRTLQNKLTAERLESLSKTQSRDETIEQFKTKLRRYEAVPSLSLASPPSSPEPSSKLVMLPPPPSAAKTSTITTDDVHSIESARQKVYEARADATLIRQSLEVSTQQCAELARSNEELVKLNSELVDTTRERGDLELRLLEWTERSFEWKSRAQEAERKLASASSGSNNNNTGSSSKSTTGDEFECNPQGMMIQAAIEKKDTTTTKRWSIFRSAPSDNHVADAGAEPLSPLSNPKTTIVSLESTISKLRSEMVQTSTAHKDEAYLIKKKIAQLEGENEALVLQNATLEKLSRFQEEL